MSGDVARAWRFIRSELGAVRELHARAGIRDALVERIKWNLGLADVDGEQLAALRAELDSTRAQLMQVAAQVDSNRTRLGAVASHLELDNPGTRHFASAASLERLLAFGQWLRLQPPTDLIVSVVIPTLNRPALLAEAVESVRAQSHPHWELIVVDDGGEEGTSAVLAELDDPRIRSIRSAGLGSSGARNAGLEIARGAVVTYLDDDNLMLQWWLAAVAWAFSTLEEVDVLYGARVLEDESMLGSGAKLPRLAFRPFDREQLLAGNYIDTSVIAHRAGLREARWDPELGGADDWDLIVRLTSEKPALALPVAAALYRTGAPGRRSQRATAHDEYRKTQDRLAAAWQPSG